MRKPKRDRSRKTTTTSSIVVGAIIGFLCFVVILVFAFFLIIRADKQAEQNRYSEYLNTFVDESVVADLCTRNVVPDFVGDCNQPRLVIRFYQIRQIMEHYLKQVHTFTEVNSLFGIYESLCNLPDRLPEPNTYRCAYEFDIGYTLVLVFDEDTDELVDIE